MKFIIGCFAVIGFIGVLMVAGCIGLASVVAVNLPAIPPYATKSNIEREFNKDLELIKKYLATSDATLIDQLSTDIYALYDDDDELLKRHHIDGKSHYISNGVGAGSLRIDGKEVQCMAYKVEHKHMDYIVYIYDAKATHGGSEPVGPEGTDKNLLPIEQENPEPPKVTE